MESHTKQRVLIVQRDPSYGEKLSAWFRAAGFDVIRCEGPQPPAYSCPLLHVTDSRRHDEPRAILEGCPLVESADALIYDPWLYVSPTSLNALPLIRALRARYPNEPLVLTWAMPGLPDLEPEIRSAENVYLGPSEPAEVVGLVKQLLRGHGEGLPLKEAC